MSSPPTPLALSTPSSHLPITILKLHLRPTETIAKTRPLLSYSYNELNRTTGEKERRVTVWESPVEGVCVRWAVREGDVLRASGDPLIYIQEPCTHDVQLHGLCALCGKDLTQVDYTGFSDTSRADISMAHSTGGLTVSLEEAHRLETLTTTRLLAAKKLSLIVDLDQTIIHATVDPTVGEWLEDKDNPNWEALKGTKRFKLGMDEGGGASSEEEDCWYYVKQRPGLGKFLKDISDIYEMHVYTMGTRAYAEEVCKIIDPDGGLFGGRILSRDESGSLTRKSLQRLFPCDTSMVVIIDDRADVWDGSPNLVKVVPYDFFVGIGDINAAFLPKKKELLGAGAPDSPAATTEAKGKEVEPSKAVKGDDLAVSAITSTTSTTSTTPSTRSTSPPTSPEDVPSLSEATASVAITIHDQIENRPLAKSQALAPVDSSLPSISNSSAASEEAPDGISVGGEDDEQKGERRGAVLKDDDRELDRVYEILKNVRDAFFAPAARNPDVKTIIPSMKRTVLAGTRVVLSGVVALGTRPEDSEHWKMATLFGAKCSTDLDRNTTHVVANQNGTAKVHRARRQPKIQIVWTRWLLDSIALWSRQPETNYLIEDPSSSLTSTTPPTLPPSPPPPMPSSTFSAMTSSSSANGNGEDTDAFEQDEEEILNAEDASEENADLGLEDVDWAAADAEVDAFLLESDSESVASVGSEDDEDDASSVGSRGSATAGGGGVKRMRPTTDSEDEGSGKGKGKGKAKVTTPASILPGSPLQKRVKTSRMRKSKLKVSFPADVNDTPGKHGGDDTEGAGEGDSDDEFIKSMAAEMEQGWGGAEGGG